MQSRDEHNLLYSNLGKVVRARRKALGLSQVELAHASKVDRAFISNIEQGLRKPSFGTVASISHGLKLKLSRLLAECEKLEQKAPAPAPPVLQPQLPDTDFDEAVAS